MYFTNLLSAPSPKYPSFGRAVILGDVRTNAKVFCSETRESNGVPHRYITDNNGAWRTPLTIIGGRRGPLVCVV